MTSTYPSRLYRHPCTAYAADVSGAGRVLHPSRYGLSRFSDDIISATDGFRWNFVDFSTLAMINEVGISHQQQIRSKQLLNNRGSGQGPELNLSECTIVRFSHGDSRRDYGGMLPPATTSQSSSPSDSSCENTVIFPEGGIDRSATLS